MIFDLRDDDFRFPGDAGNDRPDRVIKQLRSVPQGLAGLAAE
jgi:hypothetical protein